MVTAGGGRLCPACGFAAEGASLTCGSCSFILDIRAAEPALQRALDAAEEETAQLAAARALVEIPNLTSRRYVRDWLLRRLPAAHCASAMVEVLGAIDDAEARAEASRLAIENFRHKKLSGRWEVALARIPTPEARRALLAALTDRDDTARWTAAQAILEYWETTPREALPVLQRVLRNRREHEEVRFCAAGALARVDDVESRKEYLPQLLKAMRELNGSNADELPGPTRAAALLYGIGNTTGRRQAIEFLRERLPNGAEPVLALALPPLLQEGADWLVKDLVDACGKRHPRSPSAATLARAFGGLRAPRLRAEAWERLQEAIGVTPAQARPPDCLPLLAALGHLQLAEALPYLQGFWEQSEDPGVREAAREALARLGNRDALCSFTEDLLRPASDDPSGSEALRRAQRAAAVLADIQAPDARPFAIDALIRALEQPALARDASRALRELSRPPGSGTEEGRREMYDGPRDIPVAAPAAPIAPSRGVAARLAESDETATQLAHRLAVLLEDVQRQVAGLPHAYFAYHRVSQAERAEKERTLRHMLCGPVRVLMDTVQAAAAMGLAPGSGPTLVLASYLQARVHHALACDPVARESRSGDHAYHQRLENLHQAEEGYRRVIDSTQIAVYRARAYFDLAVLLAESERRAESITAFEAVVDLDVSGSLGNAAEGNLKHLRSGSLRRVPSRAHRGRASGARLLIRALAVAAAGGILWAGCTQSIDLPRLPPALRGLIGEHYWPVRVRAMGKPAGSRQGNVHGTVVVSAARLRVRSGQGRQYATLGAVQRGQRLEIVGQSDSWWKVLLPEGGTGWVARRFTGPLTP